MNFSFMIYLLLFLLMYFSLTKNFSGKTTIILVLLFLTLLLNEIYHNDQYIKKDTFSTQHSYNDYVFDKDINPYDFGKGEFKNFIIPNNYNKNLEQGIICQTQKNILDQKILENKLNSQHGYANNLRKYTLGEIKEIPDERSVFNPVYRSDLSEEKICPSVCHIIDDDLKCVSQKHVPVFKNESEFNDWKKNNIVMCSSIQNENNCKRTELCSFKNGKCFYDNKVCMLHQDQKGSQCLERCENINNEKIEQIRKLKCDSAKLNSGEKYCNWDSNNNLCVSQCGRFKTQDECRAASSRRVCDWNTFTGKCQNKT